MKEETGKPYYIRQAKSDEYEVLGRMTIEVYEQLSGMPGRVEQPEYYAMLADVGTRASIPGLEIWVAVSRENEEVLGGVTFVGDMVNYNSGGSANLCVNSSGIRLLAVKSAARGLGVGKALTSACIQITRELGNSQVILHTTKSMEIAWKMYEGMGFSRYPDLDFNQGSLSVYGLYMNLKGQ